MTNNGPFHLQSDRFKTLVYYSFFERLLIREQQDYLRRHLALSDRLRPMQAVGFVGHRRLGFIT